LRSVDHFAAACTDMTEDLLRAATRESQAATSGRSLTEREATALQAFRASRDLNENEYVRLLVAGCDLLASGKSRVEFDETRWEQLFESGQ
jgi:hypothetical protein